MKFIITYILLMLLITGNAIGQTLEEYLVVAAENNPNLKAKFFEYQAALERVPQVGALPDPQLSFGIFIKPMERFAGDQIGSISLMQMFPWIGTLGAAKEEMTFMAKANYETFNEAKSTLFYEVKATWYTMHLLEKEITITSENIELLKTIEQVALARFKSGGQQGSGTGGSGAMGSTGNTTAGSQGAGMGGMNMQSQTSSGGAATQRSMTPMAETDNMGSSGSMTDVLRVQLEMNELQNNLELLQESRIPLLARFNQLLNRPVKEKVLLADTVGAAQIPILLSEIPDSIRNNNPMLKMLEQEEASYIAQGEMNRKMGFPMIGIGLQYDIFRPGMNSPAMMNGKNMLMPMATVTLPLWRKKYNASVRESEWLQKSVEVQIQNVQNQLMVSYEDALKDFRDAERRVKLFQDQASLANQVLNLLIVQYSTGGTNFEEVLRMQQQVLDYRLNHLNAIIDGNISVAMMNRLTGR
jgi:outer membrane protein TolC